MLGAKDWAKDVHLQSLNRMILDLEVHIRRIIRTSFDPGGVDYWRAYYGGDSVETTVAKLTARLKDLEIRKGDIG